MRYNILILFLSIGVLASAQNWALINPTYKYNYSNDGTDTISNQIFVTHVDTLGVDSFRYELNKIARVCDTCSSIAQILLLNQPQFMERRVNVGPTIWHFHDPGSLVILPQAGIGETWVFDTLAAITATVTSVDVAQVFGNDEQLKLISLSTGDSIVISETYGLLSWNGRDLIGVNGPDLGSLTPSLEEVYPYQAGDIIEYSTFANEFDGTWYYNGYGSNYKFTFGDGLPGTGSITFTGMRITNTWAWTTHSFEGVEIGANNFQVSYDNTWIAGPQELPWALLATSYPGQLVRSQRDLTYGVDTIACIAEHKIDSLGRYTFGCWFIPYELGGSSPFGGNLINFDPALLESADPVPFIIESSGGDLGPVQYAAGVGLEWLDAGYFERYENYILTGAVINGDTIGTVHSDEYLIGLSVEEHGVTSSVIIGPNPASYFIQLSSATPNSIYSIFDLNGRVLATQKIRSTNERINVEQLQPGAYTLKVDGSLPQRFMIIR